MKANFEKGRKYLWAPKGTLFCLNVMGVGNMLTKAQGGRGFIPLYYQKPNNGLEYVRCEITPVKTDREVDRLTKKFARLRKKRAMLAARASKGGTTP